MPTPMATSETTEQTTACYRHPKRETAVSCSACGRPICTECMVFAPVGIKCPECAGQPAGARRAAARVRGVAGEGAGGIVTRAMIGLNIAVYVLQVLNSGSIQGVGGQVAARGALYGPAVAQGEWWRLVTAGFLHYGPIHLLFNMLVLWWFGRPLEAVLGRGRFLAVYFVSLLAGSAGALLLTPDAPTLGASGAIFGILGAGLFLERRQVYVFGGSALVIVLVNLAFSLAARGVSIGGHLGGLVGGILAMLALSRFGRSHAVYGRLGVPGIVGLLAVAVLSVAIAYARVRGLA
jgi:membrane associated rhomboid family serine protease